MSKFIWIKDTVINLELVTCAELQDSIYYNDEHPSGKKIKDAIYVCFSGGSYTRIRCDNPEEAESLLGRFLP